MSNIDASSQLQCPCSPANGCASHAESVGQRHRNLRLRHEMLITEAERAIETLAPILRELRELGRELATTPPTSASDHNCECYHNAKKC